MSVGASTLVLTVTPANKIMFPGSSPWFRQLVSVTVAGAGVAAESLILLAYRRSTLVALCVGMTGTENAATGTLDLNTTELEAVMDGVGDGAVRSLDIYLYNTATLELVGRGVLNVRGCGAYTGAGTTVLATVTAPGVYFENIDGVNYFVLKDASGVVYAKFPAPGATPND